MFSGIYHSAQAALMLLCGVMTGFLYDIFLPLRLFRSKILLFSPTSSSGCSPEAF